jgi:hypothetical protein
MTDFELENHPSNRFHQLRQEKLRSRLSKEVEVRLKARKLMDVSVKASAVDTAMNTGSLMLLRSIDKNQKIIVQQNKALYSLNKRQTEALESILEFLKERDKPKIRPLGVRG